MPEPRTEEMCHCWVAGAVAPSGRFPPRLLTTTRAEVSSMGSRMVPVHNPGRRVSHSAPYFVEVFSAATCARSHSSCEHGPGGKRTLETC